MTLHTKHGLTRISLTRKTINLPRTAPETPAPLIKVSAQTGLPVYDGTKELNRLNYPRLPGRPTKFPPRLP